MCDEVNDLNVQLSMKEVLVKKNTVPKRQCWELSQQTSEMNDLDAQ